MDAAEYNRRSAQVICYIVGGIILLLLAAAFIIPPMFEKAMGVVL